MLLKKIKLKNIRSYLDDEIIFPEGVTLLSGDIGSGKSTILLAIDFVLFGIRRGELSGSALLRNGCDEGYIILHFEIDNKNVSIKRTLKRTNNGIVQDSGYLTINDVTEQLTPVELKQRILELLNYPLDALTKKSFVYRYTVYTPQEEMKLILLGEKEYRLETLRKVFNIDKYKRIKENSKVLLSEIRQRKKEQQGVISDLETKKLNLKEKEIELIKINDQININKKRLETLTEFIITKKQAISEFEEKIKRLNEIKTNFEVISYTIKSKEEMKLRSTNQLSQIEKQIAEMLGSTKILNLENIREKIIENEKNLQQIEKEFSEIIKKSIEIKNKKNISDEIIKNIEKLEFCPLCKQNVSDEHKYHVLTREKETIEKLGYDLENFLKNELEVSSKLEEIKEIIKKYRDQEREHEISKLKLKEVENKKELIKNLNKEREEIEILINQLADKKATIEKDLEELKNVEKNYQDVKKELDDLLEQQKKVELNLAVLNKESDSINNGINNLKVEIEEKEKAKDKIEYYTKLQDWVDSFFINLIDVIEKKIMMKVHVDFNDLFQKWFIMLVEGEIIKVRLDEEFTPLIEQNGHDIEYENLSGGEKTACALAYRLALNQVINTIVSSIKTKDLIILDEPTDGFSSEQLDKIRDVLKELNMKQIIVVSHESKIESFVENIIRIEKRGHVSKALV